MRYLRLRQAISLLVIFSFLLQVQLAFASTVKLPTDTRVYIETKEALIAKGDRIQQGQMVRAKVWRDVIVDGHVLIAAGTPVVAKVDQVKKRKIAGVKGQMSIRALETESIDGKEIQLSGGYHKEGKSRMALSISLAVIVFLPLIFIPGKAAELPAGTVFDAYVDRSMHIDVGEVTKSEKVNLTYLSSEMSTEFLYEKLTAQEKPKYFEFEITVPQEAEWKFAIDRINSDSIKPIKLDVISQTIEDDEVVINARVKIKTLVKKLAKGINTIEIANVAQDERVASKLTLDIEI
ncbi:MAG: hypothetical protein DRR42_24810 [Gammaproteobacteria bacterium]|nr:MAG: hypothetical protein DRR42_24810 [Gammaproteobacteria bacterium]